MIKIFTSEQIRQIDQYTIANEPVSPYDLMERASRELFARITAIVNRNSEIMVFAGTGNNGGDGLAVTRMLLDSGYRARAYIINISPRRSREWERNYKLLEDFGGTTVSVVEASASLPVIPSGTVVVDAIFGSGLTRSPEGLAAEAIRLINDSDSLVISLDVPSGLPGEDTAEFDREVIIMADYTLVIQFPRLSFMFAENHCFTGDWRVVPIGLHPAAIARTDTPYYLLDAATVAPLLRKRSKFDHKGDFGHALLAAGSFGKMGAAILGAKATLRTGAGLLTCHVPLKGYQIIQIAVPEAMAETDQSELIVSEIADPGRFDAIAIGPGIGCKPNAQKAVNKLLSEYDGPLVIDADAINILGLNRDWLKELKPGTILTPHPKEFERIAGESENGYDRLQKQIAFSGEFKSTVILKGAHSSVSLPAGRVFFNSTGNPGMATAGSGDVLTGVVLGLLAQGYSSEEASLTAVYLHGLAGDMAALNKCEESLIASDIVENIPAAYTKLREQLL
jgi:NAD(P)H-hydrate epimerase